MNIGLIMICIGGFFGIVGLIVLIMGIRSNRRAKQNMRTQNNTQNYNNQNYNNMSNQMNSQNNGMQNGRGYQNNDMNGNRGIQSGREEFDPFNDNGNQMARQRNRVQNEDFDPFAENPEPKKSTPQMPKMPTMEDYDREDFDPFANTVRDVNKGTKPVKQSFSMPKVPDFTPESTLDTRIKTEDMNVDFDNGMGYDSDFDAGMGFDEPKPKMGNLIDLDEDLEDF